MPNLHPAIVLTRFEHHWCQRELEDMGRREDEEWSKRLFKVNM